MYTLPCYSTGHEFGPENRSNGRRDNFCLQHQHLDVFLGEQVWQTVWLIMSMAGQMLTAGAGLRKSQTSKFLVSGLEGAGSEGLVLDKAPTMIL